MEQLTLLFPSSDFTLLAVILALPLLGAFANGLFGKRLGKQAVTLIALSALGLAFVASLTGFWMLATAQSAGSAAVEHGHEAVHHVVEAARFKWTAYNWLELAGSGHGMSPRSLSLDVAFSLDALNATMSLIITGIGFLIHLYSSKYMEDDPSYYRFFAYLNLFIFSMLVLVLGDSLPILFVGWEGVGLCSYLLIGFWFQEDANAAAGKKAFITNRIGDFGLLVAMGLLAYYCGALDWAGINTNSHNLLQPVKIWPVGTDVPIAQALPDSWALAINTPRYVNAATLVGLSLFLGCAGKSAQLPLYVWLPDAMAGPTPVSALIHAATMVTAGVYLVCRLNGIFLLDPLTMFIVALIGALTALFAATIAFVQNDIKKVLAYSTVSQLGFMFLGVGVGAFVAGFFHVMTHAFFKACMFLGAGSVIHAMHARIHGTEQSQDMRNMGGMRKFMPVTFATFGVAWAAIVGFPLTSGFFSKDEILLKAKTSLVTGPAEVVSPNGRVAFDNFVWEPWMGTLLYSIGFCAAIMTAFYMTRLVIGTFFGEFKGWTIVPGWVDPHAAHAGHGHDDHGQAALGHDDHGQAALGHAALGHAAHDDHHHHEEPGPDMQGPTPHESPWQMTLPLVILGFLAAFGGFLNAHPLRLIGLHITPLENFLEPLFVEATEVVKTAPGSESFEVIGLCLAVLAFCGGAGAAYWMYVVQKGAPARKLAESFPKLHQLVYDKWRVDEFYQEYIIGNLDSLAQMCVWVDKNLVDGILARLSAFLVAVSGTVLRQFQTGRLQAYAAVLVLGMGAVGCYVIRPQSSLRIDENHATGKYGLRAAPGFGYSYRWDVDGTEGWDADFGDTAEAQFALKADEARTVRVEVQNALGQSSSEEITFVRPRPDLSSGPAGAAPMQATVTRGADGKLRGVPGHDPDKLREALKKGAH